MSGSASKPRPSPTAWTFVRLATEPYDLIIPAEAWPLPPVQALAAWLASTEGRAAIDALGGYEIERLGPDHLAGLIIVKRCILINEQRLVQTFLDLVAIDSPSGEEEIDLHGTRPALFGTRRRRSRRTNITT